MKNVPSTRTAGSVLGSFFRRVVPRRAARAPWLCPRCGGQGTTMKPPWIAGDQLAWTAGSTVVFACPVCKGAGVVTSF